MNDLLDCPDAPNPPPCFNRPPRELVSTRYGIASQTGEVIRVEANHGWFEDRCATWDGRGIGPTEDTTHYPQARGWVPWCRMCRWKPEELK